jgi:hypothetical protein
MRRCCCIKLTRAAFAADSAPLAPSFALLLMQYMLSTYFTDSRLTQLQLIGYLARGQAAAKKATMLSLVVSEIRRLMIKRQEEKRKSVRGAVLSYL